MHARVGMENPLKQAFGHARFVVTRLFGDRQIQVVPVLPATCFGPNVPGRTVVTTSVGPSGPRSRDCRTIRA